MDTHHDSHESGSSFWSAVNVLIGLAFGVFALGAGAVLIGGGLINSLKGKKTPEAAHAPAAGAPAAAPAAAAPAAAASSVKEEGGAAVVTLKPGAANPMSFDVTSFTVKAGQKVKVTFDNDSTTPLQHNWVLGVAGSKDRLIAAANGMMAEMTKWMPRGYVPDGPDVLAHTKLLNSKEKETVEFTAPQEKGDYPYLCTFPGHSMIMQGTMKVE
ncbi:plastocyanin/azurin family copper-binding protein [Verrucomicrobium sp. BvORR106]|uniref:plastocyanin/azurin family copper-binding protein n=1 Tax=Verrucomicrobium sp. BvORR106 TaxID=1403819 RepID=UPI000570D351|nr:plastocyanin/azurin family copper-binding protein [Verrucomicrobium sp. BvORR106]